MIKAFLILILSSFTFLAYSQDDLMSLMESSIEDEPAEVQSTWKGMRLISGHTTRLLNPGIMDLVISHRFGRVNEGIGEFWGLDDSQIRLGLEFGITKKLNAGFGRSSHEKVVDGYLKYRVLSQKSNGMPITMTAFTSLAIKTGDGAFTDPEYDNEFSQRLHYSYQLLIARKLSSKLSLQVMPSLIHHNIVRTVDEPNDIYAIGVGGRFKLSNRVSFNTEWYPQINNLDEYTNALSFGFDIETGGHVFQLHVTNSRAMIEEGFISETTGVWADGDIHIGFNISRSFKLKSGDKKK